MMVLSSYFSNWTTRRREVLVSEWTKFFRTPRSKADVNILFRSTPEAKLIERFGQDIVPLIVKARKFTGSPLWASDKDRTQRYLFKLVEFLHERDIYEDFMVYAIKRGSWLNLAREGPNMFDWSETTDQYYWVEVYNQWVACRDRE